MRIARLPSLHTTTLHTLYAAHSALYLAPSTIYTLLLARNSLESTLQTRRSTPHTLLIPQSLHELHAALHSPRSRRDPLNSTLHTENFKLYTADSTPHTIYTHTSHSILYTPHTQPSANTLYTPNFRFLTFHKTHSTHLALPNLCHTQHCRLYISQPTRSTLYNPAGRFTPGTPHSTQRIQTCTPDATLRTSHSIFHTASHSTPHYKAPSNIYTLHFGDHSLDRRQSTLHTANFLCLVLQPPTLSRHATPCATHAAIQT